MRIAYLDCFAGISGDMFLGALIDAGLEPNVLYEATAALNLGATLKIEKADRSGITATRGHVFEGAKLAEANPAPMTDPAHQHTHTHQHDPQTQHDHKAGHSHDHPHEHEHHH